MVKSEDAQKIANCDGCLVILQETAHYLVIFAAPGDSDIVISANNGRGLGNLEKILPT